MLEIGSFRSRSCHGVSRRSFITAAASLPLAFGLPGLAAAAGGKKHKSVMMLWLWGGPSHLDTFDPKPNASAEHRGPFQPIATRTPGAQFSELIPRIAARSDRIAVIRSTKFSGAHDMQALTGDRQPRDRLAPNFGSVIARHRPASGMPSFVSIAPRTTLGHGFKCTSAPGFGGGSFGAAYNPFIIQCAATGETDIASLKLLDGLSPQRLADRQALRQHVGQLQRQAETVPLAQWDQQFTDAYNLLTRESSQRAFDVSQESDQTRGAYGRTSFGQSLILGRRLIEAGVPYVQVNWSLGVDGLEEGSNMGWDTHRNGFGQLLNYHCPIFDRAYTALLDDLEQRGLLEDTLVVAFGEMGRTPKINNTGGRDHWATCSTLWAGGGVQGGRIIGATDPIGGEPVSDPVRPADVGATVCHVAGLDTQARAELRVLTDGRVIHELL